MPVFARTKMLIEEDCILPRPVLVLNYSGPNPQKAYPKIIELLKNVIRATDRDIQEKEFNWDRSTEVEKFDIALEVNKDLDKFSYLLFRISIGGTARPSKEFGKEGNVSVRIDGLLRTEYPQDTIWERSFLYEIIRVFYHRVFYQDARYRYKEMCAEAMSTLHTELKSFFNLLPKMV